MKSVGDPLGSSFSAACQPAKAGIVAPDGLKLSVLSSYKSAKLVTVPPTDDGAVQGRGLGIMSDDQVEDVFDKIDYVLGDWDIANVEKGRKCEKSCKEGPCGDSGKDCARRYFNMKVAQSQGTPRPAHPLILPLRPCRRTRVSRHARTAASTSKCAAKASVPSHSTTRTLQASPLPSNNRIDFCQTAMNASFSAVPWTVRCTAVVPLTTRMPAEVRWCHSAVCCPSCGGVPRSRTLAAARAP